MRLSERSELEPGWARQDLNDPSTCLADGNQSEVHQTQLGGRVRLKPHRGMVLAGRERAFGARTWLAAPGGQRTMQISV